MPNRITRAKNAVIVGRFQVPELDGGHVKLIDEVMGMHDKVVVVIGCHPVPHTKSNPLDYPTREYMFKQKFPGLTCVPLMDCSTDETWSRNLDQLIRTVCPLGSVCIYGGRDSFIGHYKGGFDTAEFPATNYMPGTEIRALVGTKVPQTAEARMGVIYATQNRFPTCFPVVDMVIYNDKWNVVICRKAGEKKWRFPGGFIDPGESGTQAAHREIMEEIGCSVTDLIPIHSQHQDDWRYRGQEDQMVTFLYAAKYDFGPVQAKDDIEEAKWVTTDEIRGGVLIPGHNELLTAFLSWRNKNEPTRC